MKKQTVVVLLATRSTSLRDGLAALLTAIPQIDEVEILQLVAQGLTNDEIAEKLVVSERTVRTHVSNILAKLQLANRTQAALYALKEGLASL